MVRHDIPCHPIHLQTSLQVKAVRIGLPRPYTVASIYLPPHDPFKDELEIVLEQLPTPFILLGDFNGRNLLWGDTLSNQRGGVLESIFQEREVAILNDDTPTHFHIQTGTFSNIDLSIVSANIALDFTWRVMEDLHGSDHYPILLEKVTGIPDCGVPRWRLERADWNLFSSLALVQGSCEEFQSVQEATDHITSQIRLAAEISVPRSSGKYRRPPVPWWSDECHEAVRARKAVLRQLKRRPDDALLIHYKKARANARRVMKEARRASWRLILSSINSATPSSWVWDKMRKIQGKSKSLPTPALKIDGNIIVNKTDVANALANSMAAISSGASYTPRFTQVKADRERRPPTFGVNGDAQQLQYNLPFTRRELESALQLCTKTAPGSDDIPYEMISHLKERSLSFLLDLYNRIYREGTVPSTWKEAIIIPIPKPGKDTAMVGNYRPISLTSCVCKLLEKMVNLRLMWFLEKNNILSPYQFGFRKMRSTTDALVRLETAIHKSFEEKHHMLAVFFDLEKAYDTTWKHGILMKLHQIGLRGALPNLIRDFLMNRRFRVRVGSSLSDPKVQLEGVPQGCILSVTLFALAINDIIQAVPRAVACSLYVDDFTLYSSGASLKIVQKRIQDAIDQVMQWAIYHGFKFSENKTVAMHFRKGLKGKPSLSLGMNPLHFVDEVKFLGLTLDPGLTWVPHIIQLKARTMKALGILRVLSHLSWGADRATLLRLYRALVRSKLDYGCEAYSSASPTVLQKLDPVHNEALRICTGAFKSSPVQSLYAESGEPPLSLHREYMNLIYYTRLQRNPRSPSYVTVMDSRSERLDPESDRRYYGGRMRKLLADLNLNLPRILEVGLPQAPPWTNLVELDLVGIGKRNRSDLEIKSRFREYTSKYQGYIAIYTDGSKSPDGVGYAAVSGREFAQGSLPPQSSIYTAELYAILAAVKMTRGMNHYDFIVYSDSRSALQAIGSLNSPHPVVREIQDWLVVLSTKKKIVLCWVPAHVGITGNELADQRAKAAAELPWDASFPLPHTDMKPSIRERLRNKWRQSWRQLKNNKLREIHEDLGGWMSNHPNRQIDVVFTRLKIGHTRLTHGFLMAGDTPPVCEECQEPLSVAHVVERCAAFSAARQKYLAPPCTLKSVLGDSCDVPALMSFLKETNIFDKI